MARGRGRCAVVASAVSVAVSLALAACGAASDGDRAAADPPARIESRSSVRLGPLSAPIEVEPPAGHPAAGVDRDAGVSARLRDGSIVWFFGDTARVRPDWSLEYFVIGTAAWATAGEPTTTRDAVAGGRPLAFVQPGPDVLPCSPIAPAAGAWPYAAAVVPDGPRDRVLVWVENVCLGDARNVESRGMSVGEWVYDPADPHADRPVTLTRLGSLSTDRWFGYAATLAPDGWIATYYCEQFPAVGADGTIADAPVCRVARVRPDDVGDHEQYEVRTVDGWTAGIDPAEGVPMSMPPTGSAADAATIARPPGAFSVGYHRGLDRYVMAYSPWPGQTAELHLRFAEHPGGPWSEAEVVELPGCSTTSNGRTFGCYAGSLQPFLDTDDELGVGWYDRIREDGGVSGNYLVAGLGAEAGSTTR